MEALNISITVNEKIMLYLLDFNKYKDSVEVPFAVSQKGIADGVEIRITHIPRAVQKLLEDGFIKEFKSHFRGHLRKRKAYFLTDIGTEKAFDLKESVGSKTVTLKTKDGSSYEKRLNDIYEDFGSMLSFFEFYKLCSKYGTLEESVIEQYKSEMVDRERSAAAGFKDLSHNIPEHDDILGRDAELGTIENWFASEELKVLFLTGTKGMGKSAIAAETAFSQQRDYHIFWINFQANDGWDKFAYGLAELASMNNFYKLDKYLKHSGNINSPKVFELLSEELGDIQLLIVLDNVDSIKNGLKELGSWLIPMLKFTPAWKIIITSRDSPPVDLKSSKNLQGKHIEIKIGGLDVDACRKILKTELSDSEFESIFKYTEGNPLYLIAIRDMEAEGKLDLSNFRPEELSLLKYLKIHDDLK